MNAELDRVEVSLLQLQRRVCRANAGTAGASVLQSLVQQLDELPSQQVDLSARLFLAVEEHEGCAALVTDELVAFEWVLDGLDAQLRLLATTVALLLGLFLGIRG